MAKNYYDILGISKSASKDEIKKAFRKLAHKYHPDKGTGNESKFKEANEAYSILSDDKKRAEYDTYGRVFSEGGNTGGNGQGFEGFDFSGFQGFGGNGGVEFDLGDIFGEFFGGGGGSRRTKRGRDISIDIELDFKESIFGVQRKILLNKTSSCKTCGGTGAKSGSETITCSVCAGKGTIRENRRSFLGSFSAMKTCDECKGKGKVPKEKCHTCKGEGISYGQEEITVKIPEGIENGEMIKLSQMGEAIVGGVPGDLYIKIHVRKHPHIKKEGNNLIMDLDVKLSDALLGEEYLVETLDGKLRVTIPEGVNFGELLRIRGKGVPIGESKRGDLLLKINIKMPKKLSRDAKKTIEELKKEGV